MDILIIGTAFLLGVGSSLHCLGMCGPLVMAVPFPRSRQTISSKTLYFMGKALAYGILGALVGLFGAEVLWGKGQQLISIISGVFLLSLLLFPILTPRIKFPFHKRFQRIFRQIKENPKWYYFAELGFLNGLLPCGMVYMAMTLAFASGSLMLGFFAMLSFGLGTTPILWSVALFRNKLTSNLKKKLKPVTTGLIIFSAVLLIFRGANLGIPYLSPKMSSVTEMHNDPDCH